MEQVLVGGDKRRSGVSSAPLMTADLGSVVQWRLGARCAVMDERRMVLSSGVMVTSTTARQGRCSSTSLKMDLW